MEFAVEQERRRTEQLLEQERRGVEQELRRIEEQRNGMEEERARMGRLAGELEMKGKGVAEAQDRHVQLMNSLQVRANLFLYFMLNFLIHIRYIFYDLMMKQKAFFYK